MAKGRKKPRNITYPYEYDPAKRKKAKAYMRIKLIAGVVNGMLIPIAFLLVFFFSGASFAVSSLAGSGIVQSMLFIVILETLLALITFPVRFWSSLVYERKYGLSRYTLKGWFSDYLKELLIEYVFSVVLLTIVYSIIGMSYWWIWVGILYFFVDVFMAQVWPVLILPFFYKLKPFQDAQLKGKLLNMIREAGVKNVETVMIARESDKSVKANAMFAGLGRTKRMILFDTLLDNFTPQEVETVIGHELGHYVHKDEAKSILLSAVLVFPVLYTVHIVLSAAPGLAGLADIAGLPIFLATMELLDIALMPLENWFSRSMERQADWFGLEASRKPEAQISTEKRLADQALSDTSPNQLVEWWLFSHPNAEKRIQMVKEWERQKQST